jgi:hypothetical protein
MHVLNHALCWIHAERQSHDPSRGDINNGLYQLIIFIYIELFLVQKTTGSVFQGGTPENA